MMRHVLRRFPIRRKLNLLLVPPLLAVLLVAVPFILGQVDNATSASLTAGSAGQARELGDLTWELQRERLLTAAYLASPRADRADLERQHGNVDNAVSNVRATLGPTMSDELTSALVRLGSLTELRRNVVSRGASADSVARTYHAVITAVIDALRLAPQRTSDAEGTRQLTALEALLRGTEEKAMRDTAVIIGAMKRSTGQVLLEDAALQARAFTERFVQQADIEHAALVVTVEESETAHRVDALAGRLPKDPDPAFVAEALTTVEELSDLRRAAQDRVTNGIANAAASRADRASAIAWLVGLGGAVLFGFVVFLAVGVSRSIANPLRRLTKAAAEVADLADEELVRVTDTETPDEQVPRLSAIEVSSRDELGELAEAFNRVQSTAAMLVERQAITRHNVSQMFANVAKRTQSLVGRQLTLVDELERDEQNERLLAALYRLDHLSTRLRRTADNLLVVAGTREDEEFTGPMELGTVLRSALAQIEDYQRVRLGPVAKITMPSPLGTDLILVFAELLENATTFSPPESTVDVQTARTADGRYLVRIVDHGIGMTPERLADENRRLVERERLDITPTTVLGLFVVGRLARRHSLTVELGATEDGGVTAIVGIPVNLVAHQEEPELPALPGNGFSWFLDFDSTGIFELRDHVSGELPAETPVPAAVARAAVQPLTVRTEVLPAVSAVPAVPVGAGRAGLTRRVPQANLAPGLRAMSKSKSAPAPDAVPSWQERDPAAERAALDAFTSGLALGAAELTKES